MDVLAAAGADLNIVDPERHTALIIALTNGHFDVAGRLIDLGADLNMQDEVGQTALWAAVDAHTMPDSNRPPPTEMDDTLTAWDIVSKLVEKGAKVDVPLRQRVPYRTKIDRGADGVLGAGTTPLLRAARNADDRDVARRARSRDHLLFGSSSSSCPRPPCAGATASAARALASGRGTPVSSAMTRAVSSRTTPSRPPKPKPPA